MSIRLRHVYFDEDGTARPISQARLGRVLSPDTREPLPELAGRRVRFLTLYVLFDEDVAIEVSRAEPSLIAFDDEGRRDQAEASRERHAAVQLLDDTAHSTEPGLITAGARFQTAGFRWKPTPADLDAAIAIHRLRRT